MGILTFILLMIGCFVLLAIGICMVVWSVFYSIGNGANPNDI
jgi:hypothetical protein